LFIVELKLFVILKNCQCVLRISFLNLYLQEKHKDKKHKKDKREGKEKREKDNHHSKEKQRDNDKDKEKKERKEKHKHKRKERERDKESDKDKHRTQSVQLQVPAEKISEDSRILSELSRGIDEGPQAGSGSQFVERRAAGTSSHGASEKRPALVLVQHSVPSVHRKSNDAVKAGPTNQLTNHRATVASERRVTGMPSTSSPEEGMIARRTVSSASSPNVMNFNSLVQTKSNGPPNQVMHHHGHGFTERRVVGTEAKKTVLSPFNSLQGKSNGPSSQSTNRHQLPASNAMKNRVTATERGDEAKRVAGNSVVQMQRKTDGPTFQVVNNHHAADLSGRRVGLNQSSGPTSTPEKEKDSAKGGLRGSEAGSVKQEEGKKEKRKDRDERKKEKEQKRLEKKQRKEREKEEREKKKGKERDKVKEVSSLMRRPSIAESHRSIEKVGATDGYLSKKRKEGDSNGFLHGEHYDIFSISKLRCFQLYKTSLSCIPFKIRNISAFL
jgi:hypothetical protein